jgi:hypothetical protein
VQEDARFRQLENDLTKSRAEIAEIQERLRRRLAVRAKDGHDRREQPASRKGLKKALKD